MLLKDTKRSAILLLGAFILRSSLASTTFMNFNRVQRGYDLSLKYTLKKFPAESKLICAASCQSNNLCQGFSLNSKGLCTLTDVDYTRQAFFLKEDAASAIYWKEGSIDEYMVDGVKVYTDNGRYFTPDNLTEVCTRLRMRAALPENSEENDYLSSKGNMTVLGIKNMNGTWKSMAGDTLAYTNWKADIDTNEFPCAAIEDGGFWVPVSCNDTFKSVFCEMYIADCPRGVASEECFFAL